MVVNRGILFFLVRFEGRFFFVLGRITKELYVVRSFRESGL